jgi:hypothetical protein
MINVENVELFAHQSINVTDIGVEKLTKLGIKYKYNNELYGKTLTLVDPTLQEICLWFGQLLNGMFKSHNLYEAELENGKKE